MDDKFLYDICLSFAGEDRDYVDNVANVLKQAGVKVFYDKYERETLWGKDLYQHLDSIYQNKAEYCVIFISKKYKEKLWTKHELRSAQARAFREHQEYILPARFDDTQLPGILDTVGYINLHDLPPSEFAQLILSKIQKEKISKEKPKVDVRMELERIDADKEVARTKTENIIFNTNENYIALDHGIPFYKHQNIVSKKTSTKLIIAVPEKYHKKLNQGGNVFEIRKQEINSWEKKFIKAFGYFKIDDYDALISKAADKAAEEFVSDINNGFHRFNSELFGIDTIIPSRIGKNEEASLGIHFYATDYFTYRVFGIIYQMLMQNNKVSKTLKIPDINKYFTPFLSSFGIGCFIILDRGKGDEILLGHRSNSVMVDKGKLHYSMNEAFSLNDAESIDGFPSLKSCLFRGFREELGISAKFEHNIIDFGFLDLGIITDRCEVGISAFARIDWDKNFQFRHLGEMYSIAQDSELETDMLELVEMRSLDEFIKLNYEKMSEGCRSSLKLLLARYKAGYF